MYHPAAALHQGSLKATLFRDMEGVPMALLEARKTRAERLNQAPPSEPAATALGAAAHATTTQPIAQRPAEPAPAIPGGPDGHTAESDPTDQLGLF
jgi:hypothetical protein